MSAELKSATKISENGINFIKQWEGFRPVAYNDTGGLPTIGYGHLIKEGEEFASLTQQEAHNLLLQDLIPVERCINTAVKAFLCQNEFDALCSFVYNLGCQAFKNSTLLGCLNYENYGLAAQQFLRWNKGRLNGRLVELPGLTRRRQAEKALFSDCEEFIQ